MVETLGEMQGRNGPVCEVRGLRQFPNQEVVEVGVESLTVPS